MNKTEKMNCKRCHIKLIPFLEGSLKGAEMLEVENHLQECDSCRGFAAYLQKNITAIESSRFTEPDPFFLTRVKARLERKPEIIPVKAEWIRILQPVVFSMLLIAAVFAGIEIGSTVKSAGINNYATEDLFPYINEMDSEPLETFLMDN